MITFRIAGERRQLSLPSTTANDRDMCESAAFTGSGTEGGGGGGQRPSNAGYILALAL